MQTRFLLLLGVFSLVLGCGGGKTDSDATGGGGRDVKPIGDLTYDTGDETSDRPGDATDQKDPWADWNVDVPKDQGQTPDPSQDDKPSQDDDPGPVWDPGEAWTPEQKEPDDDAVGGCDPCGYGSIAGMTCAPNATAAIPYVKVWVDTVDCEGNPVVISTYSDAGGNYRLDNVPCGTQTILMKKGSFEHAFIRWVDKGMTTIATSGDACMPKTALRIAIVTGDWDQIQAILVQLRFHFKLFDGQSEGENEGVKLLTGKEARTQTSGGGTFKLLDDFDVVFINCSPSNAPMMNEFGNAISPVLRQFVEQSGSVYASDYASIYIYKTWPSAWNGSFPQDFPGSSGIGGSGRQVTANIVDADLAAYMNKSTAIIEYRLGPLTSIVGTPGAGTNIHLEGPNSAYGNAVQPFMISFQPNGIDAGRVIYTNFHNEEQVISGGDLSDMAEVLQYIVFLM